MSPSLGTASLNYKPLGHIRQYKRTWWGYNLLYLPHGYEAENKNINSKLDVVTGTIITALGRLWSEDLSVQGQPKYIKAQKSNNYNNKTN